MGSVFLKFLAGAAAGLLTGLLTEPSAPTALNDPNWALWQGKVFLIFGALLGGVVGVLDGLSKGGAVWTWRGLGLGALLGAIGVNLGAGIGGGLANGIFGNDWLYTGALPTRMIARTLFFLGIGTFIGAGIGASSLNVRKLIQGAVGGLVGGAIGGLLFDPIGEILGRTILVSRGQLTGEVGGPSRMVGWILVGSMVALMIGLVDRLTRKAWLRADFGRNEFKEWPLDATQNLIGRGETCHVILRNDPQVAPVHASIARQGSHFIISDAGTPAGTFVNGHRIAQAALQPGDMVQIGSFAMRFMVKNQQVAYAPHMQMPMQPGPMPQQMPPQPMPGQPMPGQPMPGQPMQGYGMPTQMMPQQPPMSTGQPTVAFGAPPMGGASLGPPTLVAMDGPFAGQRFPVSGMIEIGREASGIALMGDANASRRHASVSPGVGGVQVNDLGSTNG
ncbi:MAG: FHA domain-containing protein, partial [Sphingomonadales bacterium]